MIEMGKTYRTNNGCEVRIYAIDGGGARQVHGAFKYAGGWISMSWNINGNGHDNGDYGLVEVKPRIKRTGWVNVYDVSTIPSKDALGLSNLYNSKDDADRMAFTEKRIACVQITIDCEHGEGL